MSRNEALPGGEMQAGADESASRTDSELLANISHEIRTPMNGVLGMTELLLESGLTETPRRYAQNIQTSSEALLHVLNAILDFSKIDDAGMRVDTPEPDMRKTSEELVDLMAARARAKGLVLECRIDDSVCAQITVRLKPAPRLDSPQDRPPEVRPPSRDVSKKPEPGIRRVLLVEDNRVNQEVGKAMLRTLGYEVDVRADGRAGLEAAFERRYDVVLMDCQMPEMDGYTATAAIRAREADAGTGENKPPRMPIIALTANAMKGDRERCLAAGMDDYLAKPFRKEQLKEVLTRWIEGPV